MGAIATTRPQLVKHMKQKQLIIDYIKQTGSIIPAKMSGVVYKGQMFGSEISRRARELREAGEVKSEMAGKFERFYIPEIKEVSMAQMTWEERGGWLRHQPVDVETRRKRFFALCHDLGHDTEKAKERAKRKYGVEHFADLNLSQVNELIELLEGQQIFRKDKEIYDSLVA